jgi:hypothetical protein
MHRNSEEAQNKAQPNKAMRPLALLLWIACFMAGLGCGKEPPVVKTEPMRKHRIPSRVVTGRNP